MSTLLINGHQFQLIGGNESVCADFTKEIVEEGLELVHLRLTFKGPIMPPMIRLEWKHPVDDIHGVWQPNGARNRGLNPDFLPGYASRLTNSAPVVSLFSGSGRNKMTFAFSDALNPIGLKAGVHEETAEFHCAVSLFEEALAPISSYEAILRVDCRSKPYYESLHEVQAWWSSFAAMQPAKVPSAAREPVYSTWYSFHQMLVPEEIEQQCRLAKQLGCDSVIVDDGWQTADNTRGYAYCGDWEASIDKIPNMKMHVSNVQGMGMKYLLWYSVPYVGMHTKAWQRFKDKMLYVLAARGWGIVDPRYPEVREYLINIYEQALLEWGLDGFKLDFIDSFLPPAGHKLEYGNGRDYVSVPDAVDRLMTDILHRLQSINPDVMIEFRQAYVGPLMRKYGNMFRASDCPNDSIENRVRTIDIRLLSGNTPVHADMIMWNSEEPVQSAALQMINILFSVPQISVKLDRLPDQHREMLAFWLEFWKEYRYVLLDGQLKPSQPELLYPLVMAETDNTLIAAVYARTVVALDRKLPEKVLLINGTREAGLYVDYGDIRGVKKAVVKDCTGRIIKEHKQEMRVIHKIEVPPAGLVEFSDSMQ